MYQQPAISRGVGAVAPDTLGKVLGLLGLCAIFSAAGALAWPIFGTAGLVVSAIGSIVCVVGINAVKDRAPLNLVVLMAFALFEGMLVGSVASRYAAAGASDLVFTAAAATGLVTLVAGAVGYTTKRNLAGWGGFLFAGILALLVTMLVGFFVQLPALQIAISAGGALLFTAFLVFDLNRIARAGSASEGDTIVLAMGVYLDIVNLFLFILRLLGATRR